MNSAILKTLQRIMQESEEVPAGFDINGKTWWAEAHRVIAKAEQMKGASKKKPFIAFFMDQYGNRFTACNRKELTAQIPGHVSKLYVDKVDGTTAHVGYVVGQHWCTAYAAVEIKVLS